MIRSRTRPPGLFGQENSGGAAVSANNEHVKYLPGLMVGQLSGSVGSTTASHNWAGSYFRSRTIPTNPNTPSQTAARVAFTNFTQTWRTLSAATQLGWENLAMLDPIIDPLGASIVLPGIAYYTSFNMTRRSAGLARLDTAPPLVEVPPGITAAVLVASVAATIDYTPTVVDGTASNHQVIYATAPISPGVTFLGRGDFRVIARINGNAPLLPPEDLTPAYQAVFGSGWTSSIGMQIGFRFKGVSDVGFTQDFLQELTTIVA